VNHDDARSAWLCLALAELPARVRPADLLRIGGDAVGVLRAREGQLAVHMGRTRARATQRALARARPDRILRAAAARGQEVVTPADPAWPSAAFEGLGDPPCALFLRGQLPAADASAAAIVGTRDATPYGLRVAREMAVGLAEAGVWVVSGMAVGIDGAAHEGALEGGGPTLAVLGCGLDFAYPMAHADLKEEVVMTGGLLSEHAPGTPPQKWHFPRRNRLVAALSQVTVVVEAAARSGALITARLALDQGREVAAVPGSVFGPQRAGCHRLLRQGAALCEGVGDVLALLGLGASAGARAVRSPPATEPEASLWGLLDEADAIDAAELCRRTGLGAAEVSAALTALEVDGRLQRLPGVGFLRR